MIDVTNMKKAELIEAATILGIEAAGMTVSALKAEVESAVANLKADGINAGLTETQVDLPEAVQELWDLVNRAESGETDIARTDEDDFQEVADAELAQRQAVLEAADAQAAAALGAEDDGFSEVKEGEVPAAPAKKGKKIKLSTDKWEGVADEVIRGDVIQLAAKKNIEIDPVNDMNREQLIAKYAELKSAKKQKKASDQPRQGRSFTPDQVREIRREHFVNHATPTALAEKHNVSSMLIRNIIKGNLYKDVAFETYSTEELDGTVPEVAPAETEE